MTAEKPLQKKGFFKIIKEACLMTLPMHSYEEMERDFIQDIFLLDVQSESLARHHKATVKMITKKGNEVRSNWCYASLSLMDFSNR